jgi:molybdate transport system substrate-binding protein
LIFNNNTPSKLYLVAKSSINKNMNLAKKQNGFFFIFILFILFTCVTYAETKITVFAAASLTEVTKELANDFKKNHDLTFRFNFASSGQLARQIVAGAPADIFLSANLKWLDYVLQDKKNPKIAKSLFAKNRLVFIQNLKKTTSLKIIFTKEFPFASSFKGRIAMGDPLHVPAGQYAMEAFKKLHWDNQIKNRILPCSSVREALRMIEINEWDLGVSYLTDAQASNKVKVIATFPEELHSPINYGACVLGDKSDAAKEFLAYLQSESAIRIMEKFGFQKLKE